MRRYTVKENRIGSVVSNRQKNTLILHICYRKDKIRQTYVKTPFLISRLRLRWWLRTWDPPSRSSSPRPSGWTVRPRRPPWWRQTRCCSWWPTLIGSLMNKILISIMSKFVAAKILYKSVCPSVRLGESDFLRCYSRYTT